MNTELILRRMMLLGFMLMTMSINVFADNANDEEKNPTNVPVEKSVDRSIVEDNIRTMEISLQNEEPVPIPYDIYFEGYQLDINRISVIGDNPGCIELINDGARLWRLRVLARYLGRAIIRLLFDPIPIEDGPTLAPIYVDIHVTVVL